MWVLTLFLTMFRGLCACGEFYSRSHGEVLPPPIPVSQLKMPFGPDEGKASGTTSDQDMADDHFEWEKETEEHGLFAPACNAHCILINGDPSNRLGKKVCIRPVSKLITLLSGGELFSSGERVKPSESNWADTVLCTFRREPYIQSRADRRRKVGDCFKKELRPTCMGLVLRGANSTSRMLCLPYPNPLWPLMLVICRHCVIIHRFRLLLIPGDPSKTVPSPTRLEFPLQWKQLNFLTLYTFGLVVTQYTPRHVGLMLPHQFCQQTRI